MDFFRLILYIIFGILPSLAWLFYYLQKDLHPEPKRMIVKIFLWGSFITVPVFLLQVALITLSNQLHYISFFNNYPGAIEIIKWFFIIAFIEETFKYIVVKMNVLGSYALDEPLDIMLYMVVAALGFAAVENILYLFSPAGNLSFASIIEAAMAVSLIRFIGATFLHTLCSGLVGYFMAKSSLRAKKRFRMTILGIILATLLHGLYDFSIITLQSPLVWIVPAMIIIGLALFMMYDFDEIKKVKSICKI
jgi:RsiW-degrading membrane proteinase PrsW (M82 family)